MPTLEPVDFDPFAAPQTKGAKGASSFAFEPVDFDPFEGGPAVAKRGLVLPLAEMSDGTTQLAVPEIVNAPYRGFIELWESLSADPGAKITPELAGKAFDAASAAITGPVVVGAKAAVAAAKAPATVAEAGRNIGVALPRAATGSDAVQAAGTIAKEIPSPLFGNPVVQQSERALDQLANVAKTTLDQTGTGRPAPQSFRDWFQARGLTDEALAAEAGTATKTKQVAAYEAPTGPDGAMRITTPDNAMEVTARPQLMELDDLKTAAGDFQPRDRSRAEYVQGVRERASRLDPEQLRPGRVSDSGAPIVLPDNTIISGNGRAMSIAEAYRNPAFAERSAAYRASLGPEAANMRNPVLVMRAEGLAGDDAARFADLSNRGRIAQMSATERAARDAKALGLDSVRLYQGGDFTSPANEAFLRAFTSKAVAAGEGAALSKNGQLTQEGIQRMRNAVLAAAYDDAPLLSRLVESSDDNVRAITGAMSDVAPKVAGLKADIVAGVVKGELDPTSSLVEAVKKIADLRNNNQTPARFFAQADAFDATSPLAKEWIKALYNPEMTRPLSRERMTAVLNAYADEAGKHAPGGLFDDPTTIGDVINAAGRVAARESGEAAPAATASLFDAPAAAAVKDAAPAVAPAAPTTAAPSGVKPPPASAGTQPAKQTSDDALKSYMAKPKTAQEVVFEARKARLAQALGVQGDITPTAAIARIEEMTRSRASADVTGLLNAKKMLGDETWSDVAHELLAKSGLGNDLAAFSASWGKMTDTAKTALYGEAKARLDDLATVATRIGRLKELATPEFADAVANIPVVGRILGTRLGQAGGVASVAALDAGVVSLPTAAAAYTAANFLSRPEGAKTMTRWLKAVADDVEASGPQSKALLTLTGRNLAKELADDTDGDERAIAAEINAAVAATKTRGR